MYVRDCPARLNPEHAGTMGWRSKQGHCSSCCPHVNCICKRHRQHLYVLGLPDTRVVTFGRAWRSKKQRHI